MKHQEKLELTTSELLERGWTRTLIKRFLPRPDGCIPVDYWANFRGQDTYSAIKVWNLEQSDTFSSAFLKTWNGRKSGRMKGTTPQKVLVEMRKAPHPKVPPRTKDDIQLETLIAEISGIFEEVRARGYRTPHRG
ncbi:hypothetical protein ACMAZE_08485 [Pseudopelagicola sp. nBUS_20]|uniref:hypothetical protein n=1 Tax=Pseudopelagicola sp. nBUS_20 TaxID=3395317 RepID=UPI003EC0BB40